MDHLPLRNWIACFGVFCCLGAGLPSAVADEPQNPLAGWVVIDEGTVDAPSEWSVAGNQLSQFANIYGGSDDGGVPDKPGTYVLAGSRDWTDYTLTAEIVSDDNDAIGVMFRYRDPDNYYRFSMDQQRGYRRLVKRVDGVVTTLAEDGVPYDSGRWYPVRISVAGPRIEVVVDGFPVFAVGDDSHTAGRVAMYCWGNAGSHFRDITVELAATRQAETEIAPTPLTPEGEMRVVDTVPSTVASPAEPATADLAEPPGTDAATAVPAMADATVTRNGATAVAESVEPHPPLTPAPPEPEPDRGLEAGAASKAAPPVAANAVPVAPTAGGPAPFSGADVPPKADVDYLIGPGDVLLISVWKDEALTRQAVVLPDGRITFPLIGEIAAAGKTVAGLQLELEAAIGRYVPDPVLSIGVQQVNSMLIYVIGKVNRPGQFNLNAHSTVLQALAMAGGLTVFAEKDEIKIMREEGDGTRIFPFDYEEVAAGEHLEQNIRLQRGDVIVVP